MQQSGRPFWELLEGKIASRRRVRDKEFEAIAGCFINCMMHATHNCRRILNRKIISSSLPGGGISGG